MTQKTVTITILDHRSLWNSSNPEEGVSLLILNMKQQPFHLHTATSCSPPSNHPSICTPQILLLSHPAHVPHILAICCSTHTLHLLVPHSSTCRQHVLASHSGNYKSRPLTLHFQLLSASHSLCLFICCSELHILSNTALIWHHTQCRKTQT